MVNESRLIYLIICLNIKIWHKNYFGLQIYCYSRIGEGKYQQIEIQKVW